MKYLYIFEDGEFAESARVPTGIDKQLIEDGCLSVLTFVNGSYFEFSPEGNAYPILQTRVIDGYHVPPSGIEDEEE